MYLAIVLLLMGILPVVSIVIELAVLHGSAELLLLIGKWFVFWSVGVRLLLAGLRQAIDPKFTAETIFAVRETAALTLVQELGFGNIAIGLLGVLTIVEREWTVPAAITGGVFYGLAGVKHLVKGGRNATETIAMVSDLVIFAVLAGYLAGLFRPG
jgi:hypothetical protein